MNCKDPKMGKATIYIIPMELTVKSYRLYDRLVDLISNRMLIKSINHCFKNIIKKFYICKYMVCNSYFKMSILFII